MIKVCKHSVRRFESQGPSYLALDVDRGLAKSVDIPAVVCRGSGEQWLKRGRAALSESYECIADAGHVRNPTLGTVHIPHSGAIIQVLSFNYASTNSRR